MPFLLWERTPVEPGAHERNSVEQRKHLSRASAPRSVPAIAGATGALARRRRRGGQIVSSRTQRTTSTVRCEERRGEGRAGEPVEYHAPDLLHCARRADRRGDRSKPDAILFDSRWTALEAFVMNARPPAIRRGSTAAKPRLEWVSTSGVGGNLRISNAVKAGEIMGGAGVKNSLCVNQEVACQPRHRCNGFAWASQTAHPEVSRSRWTDGIGGLVNLLTANPDPTACSHSGERRKSVLQRLRGDGNARQSVGTFDLSPVALEPAKRAR